MQYLSLKLQSCGLASHPIAKRSPLSSNRPSSSWGWCEFMVTGSIRSINVLSSRTTWYPLTLTKPPGQGRTYVTIRHDDIIMLGELAVVKIGDLPNTEHLLWHVNGCKRMYKNINNINNMTLKRLVARPPAFRDLHCGWHLKKWASEMWKAERQRCFTVSTRH